MKKRPLQHAPIPSPCSRGFSMLMVLMILVILATLGLALRQLTVTHHMETAQSLAIRQAQLAARSALDWARNRLVVGNQDCNGLPTSLVVEGITVTFACIDKTPAPKEGTTNLRAFKVTASATVNTGEAAEANRTLWIEVYDER